jgi:hypothetical protein
MHILHYSLHSGVGLGTGYHFSFLIGRLILPRFLKTVPYNLVI